MPISIFTPSKKDVILKEYIKNLGYLPRLVRKLPSIKN